MRKVLAVLAVVAVLTSLTAAASGIYSVNGSEPAFLHDIGPQDERADHPFAAAVVAVAVAVVILRGLRRYEETG